MSGTGRMTPAERAVIEAAELWRGGWHERANSTTGEMLTKAVDALRAERAPKPRWVVMPNGIIDKLDDDASFITINDMRLPERLKLAERICRLLNESENP